MTVVGTAEASRQSSERIQTVSSLLEVSPQSPRESLMDHEGWTIPSSGRTRGRNSHVIQNGGYAVDKPKKRSAMVLVSHCPVNRATRWTSEIGSVARGNDSTRGKAQRPNNDGKNLVQTLEARGFNHGDLGIFETDWENREHPREVSEMHESAPEARGGACEPNKADQTTLEAENARASLQRCAVWHRMPKDARAWL